MRESGRKEGERGHGRQVVYGFESHFKDFRFCMILSLGLACS